MNHWPWIPAGGAMSFLVAFTFGDREWLPVDVYYLIYMASVAGFLYLYARRTGLDVRAVFARRWKAGLVLGLVFGTLLIRNVLLQPQVGRLEGWSLSWALVWRGVLYGAVDGMLMLAFPWIVVWRALRAEGGRTATKVIAGAIALAAMLFVTIAYHLGYRDFRSEKVFQPVTGSAIASWATLLSANPVAGPMAHVFMHVGAVLRQPEGGLFLPPHRRHADGTSP